MKRYLLTSVALTFAAVLGFTANLNAGPPHAVVHGHPAPHIQVVNHGHVGPVHPAHFEHYHVRGFRGWNSRCWFPAYGTYGYYCGADQLWYYWYEPFGEYLPTTYLSMYPPMAAGVAPVNLAPIGASVGLPAGATFVPGPIVAP